MFAPRKLIYQKAIPNKCNNITKIAPGIPPIAHISIVQIEYLIPRWNKKLANAKIINPIIVFIITCFIECKNK